MVAPPFASFLASPGSCLSPLGGLSALLDDLEAGPTQTDRFNWRQKEAQMFNCSKQDVRSGIDGGVLRRLLVGALVSLALVMGGSGTAQAATLSTLSKQSTIECGSGSVKLHFPELWRSTPTGSADVFFQPVLHKKVTRGGITVWHPVGRLGGNLAGQDHLEGR
jgi:hypothetical protein